MSHELKDIIRYRGDRLFNGAVNISWFGTDEQKTKAASESFVFHGPKYHGVQQEDVGTGHGHRLTDTASFARMVARVCYGSEDQPFTLAIAGYGTGKSHLGLTLASLFSAPASDNAAHILSSIDAADPEIGNDIRMLLQESEKPCLTVALNGMQSFDLAAEITKQIVRNLRSHGRDPKPLDDLRPRFAQAANLIRMSNESVVNELITACKVSSTKEILSGLDQQDERSYAKVHDFFAARGMPIRALAGESVKDVIDVTVREYCGKGKPYRCLLILFDEFGKYTEFATVRSQIAGSGALQDLFEAIQANTGSACFVGFIQFELNAYVQRVAPEYKNEILRYVTRYQQANRVYLSINLETLIASLLEKQKPKLLDKWFDSKEAMGDSKNYMENLARWFPQSVNYRLWNDLDQFHLVVSKGCWPLSPYATWFLFYLAAAGKHLQERSALALLGDVIQRNAKMAVPDKGGWSLAPADLWSESLQHELVSTEEVGQQGSIALAYASVMARHGARLSPDLQRLLCSVVLASKLGLQVASKKEAATALAELSGLAHDAATDGVRLLQEEYNVLEWDDAFKAFDILGDAVPRSQFLAFLRQRVANTYTEAGKSQLFASKAREWCDILGDLECDFAEENKITTREWRFQAETSNHEYLPQHIKLASDRWVNAFAVDEPRGTVVYVYVEPSRDPAAVLDDARRYLKEAARDVGCDVLPILIVTLADESGALGNALAEYAVLDEGLSTEDNVRFGNLIKAHKEKSHHIIMEQVEKSVKERRYVTGLPEELTAHRLNRVGTELFARIYNSPLTFPFDGFSTPRGNAADTCYELTYELLLGKLDYEAVTAKPAKAKNRALTVLKSAWGIFTQSGKVSRRPADPVVRLLSEKWDAELEGNKQRLPVADSLRQLCRPPYGGNIASAGLLLGVYVAPRIEKLIVVREGQQIAISKIVQDGIFQKKFIDLSSLDGVDFILLGEASTEWETLLDEWEQAENHLARINCLSKYQQLRNRVPIPPALTYRAEHLRDQASASNEAITKKESTIEEALSKINKAEQKSDVGFLSWGAADLKALIERMENERPLWTDKEIGEVHPHYERTRQAIVHYFPAWLERQKPLTDTPDKVADFKHKMLDAIGKNLKKIALTDEYDKLEAHTLYAIRNAEILAEFTQLQRDVKSWGDACGYAIKAMRVDNLKSLQNSGKTYIKKILDIQKKIKIAEIDETQKLLLEFSKKLRESEEALKKRAGDLWQSKLENESDIDRILGEVDSLVVVFDNLPSDLEDLHLMRKALKLFQKSYQRLADVNIGWAEFAALSSIVRQECVDALREVEIPWPPDEVISVFVHNENKRREAESARWLAFVEEQAKALQAMSVADANRLHQLASNPPPVISESDRKRAAGITGKVEERLTALNVEWLLERFRALSPNAKKEFLEKAQKLYINN